MLPNAAVHETTKSAKFILPAKEREGATGVDCGVKAGFEKLSIRPLRSMAMTAARWRSGTPSPFLFFFFPANFFFRPKSQPASQSRGPRKSARPAILSACLFRRSFFGSLARSLATLDLRQRRSFEQHSPR